MKTDKEWNNKNWHEIQRTPQAKTVNTSLPVAALGDPGTPIPDELMPEVVGEIEATASQYDDLEAAARAITALGRLKERIPPDLRAHAVTTCLFLAEERKEEQSWPALRERRRRAQSALRKLRAIAPRELVWEIDELFATGKWNTSRRFPRAGVQRAD